MGSTGLGGRETQGIGKANTYHTRSAGWVYVDPALPTATAAPVSARASGRQGAHGGYRFRTRAADAGGAQPAIAPPARILIQGGGSGRAARAVMASRAGYRLRFSAALFLPERLCKFRQCCLPIEPLVFVLGNMNAFFTEDAF